MSFSWERGGRGMNYRQASASKSRFLILFTQHPHRGAATPAPRLSYPPLSISAQVFDPPLTAALRAVFRRKPIGVGHPDLLQGVLRQLSSRRSRHSRLWGWSSAAVPSATTAKRERPRRCALASQPASRLVPGLPRRRAGAGKAITGAGSAAKPHLLRPARRTGCGARG